VIEKTGAVVNVKDQRFPNKSFGLLSFMPPKKSTPDQGGAKVELY
jgi:hypothetical protein